MEKEYIPHSTGCFICGQDNKKGISHKFYVLGGTVCCDVNIPSDYCGYKNVIHGGIVTALLDEPMGWCAYVFGKSDQLCFTRNLEVKFKKNAPTETDLVSVAKLKAEKRGMYEVEAELKDEEGTVYAKASGLFVPIGRDKMDETVEFLLRDKNLKYHSKFIDEYGEKIKICT